MDELLVCQASAREVLVPAQLMFVVDHGRGGFQVVVRSTVAPAAAKPAKTVEPPEMLAAAVTAAAALGIARAQAEASLLVCVESAR
mmetsp:Transcript_38077/g.119959  ORF Transcript_38077/g.119959 Transcript_38077/m.119959 type:complete len:86 (+) Transcript_38077:784-1041(+)